MSNEMEFQPCPMPDCDGIVELYSDDNGVVHHDAVRCTKCDRIFPVQ